MGKALYWERRMVGGEVCRGEIAERHHLHKPVMEQPQYSMFVRRVEVEYAVFSELWLVPLPGAPAGLLTGRYNSIQRRFTGDLPEYEWLKDHLTNQNAIARR